jgi:hypothetical protein
MLSLPPILQPVVHSRDKRRALLARKDLEFFEMPSGQIWDQRVPFY